MARCFSSLAARVASPNQIGFVKFIIESYDGLAIVSTTDPKRGEILLRFHPEQNDELLALLRSLRVDIAPQSSQAPKGLH